MKDDSKSPPDGKGLEIGRLSLCWWQEYTEWSKNQMWHDFHIVLFHVENTAYNNSVELNIGMLGLCLHFEWYYGKPME